MSFKIRFYIYLILLATMGVLILPLVFSQTTQLNPVLSYITIIIILPMLLENTITFQIVKHIDNLQYATGEGRSGFILFIKIIGLLLIMFFSIIAYFNVNKVSPGYLGTLWLFLILDNTKIFIGNQIIFSQGSYINISKIHSFTKDTYKDYIQFTLYTENKSYSITFKATNTKGITLLTSKLSNIPEKE